MIQRAPLSLLWLPNQPLMWIELTVAVMPASRMSATTCSMARASSRANSLWSTAMSVTRPALSRASVAPGTSRRMRCATSFSAFCVAGTCRGVLHEVDLQHVIHRTQRDGAVLGHDRVDRPALRRRARERLAPAQRAAGDGDHTHASGSQAAQRRERNRLDGAVARQGVVDVGQEAIEPTPTRRRSTRSARRAGAHELALPCGKCPMAPGGASAPASAGGAC